MFQVWATCFAHFQPTRPTVSRFLPSLSTQFYVSLFTLFETDLCLPNILGCLLFHMVDLLGATVLESLSHQLMNANCPMAQDGIIPSSLHAGVSGVHLHSFCSHSHNHCDFSMCNYVALSSSSLFFLLFSPLLYPVSDQSHYSLVFYFFIYFFLPVLFLFHAVGDQSYCLWHILLVFYFE